MHKLYANYFTSNFKVREENNSLFRNLKKYIQREKKTKALTKLKMFK